MFDGRFRANGMDTCNEDLHRRGLRGRITVTPQAAGAARGPRGASSDHRLAMVAIGLAVAARIARDPRSHETAIMAMITVAAVAGLGRASQARSFARLAAWDKRRNASEPRTLKAPASPAAE
jgi:hypothetical protein